MTMTTPPDATAALVEALTKIERWEMPPTGKPWRNVDGTLSDRPMSFGACFGSNGERDHIRSIAREALATHAAREVAPADEMPAVGVTDDQIKHMVARFLSMPLPTPFQPDNGISFDRVANLGTEHQYYREPVGTNLFTAAQAEAMVRYMVEGLDAPAPADAEETARAWLDDRGGEHPNDRDYGADDMVDAFMAGRSAAGVASRKFARALEAGTDSNVNRALNQRMCCSGHHCGCLGATIGEYLAHQLLQDVAPAPAGSAPELREALAKIGPLPICPEWMYTVIRHGQRNMDVDASEGFNEPDRQCGGAIAELINALPGILDQLSTTPADGPTGARTCTCHPDDQPKEGCRQRYAATDCATAPTTGAGDAVGVLSHDDAISALTGCAATVTVLSYQEAIEGYFALRGLPIPGGAK